MLPFLRCECYHVFAIETDAIVMHEVWVFFRIDPARCEVEDLFVLIHVDDLPHAPFPFRDLPFHSSCGRVIEVEMVPVVALAHPDELTSVFEVISEVPGVVDECCGRLLDDGAQDARLCVHSEYAVGLMSSLVEIHGHLTAVGSPCEGAQLILR